MSGEDDRKRELPDARELSPQVSAPDERPRRATRFLALAVAGFCVGVLGVVVATRFWPAERGQPGESVRIVAPPSAGQEAAPPPLEDSAPNSPERAEIRALREEASRVAERLTGAFPSDPHAIAVSAQLAYRLGDSARAIQYWQRCLEVEPGFLDAYYKMALIATERGEYRQAEQHYRDLLARGPRASYALTGLAETLLNLSRTEEAIDVLHEDQQLHARSPAGLVLLGQAYLQLREHEKARACFESVIETAPKYGPAHHGLATACARLGQTEAARRHRERFQALKGAARSSYPDPGGVLRDLKSIRRCLALVHTGAAEVYQRHGNLAEAERHYLGAAAADRTHTASRAGLAALCQEAGQTEEALRWLDELRQIEPDNPRWPLLIGNLHARSAHLDAAEEAFRRVCELAPHRAAGYAALAQLYVLAGKEPSRAVEVARKAVALEPVAPAYYALSAALRANGDLPAARTAIERAIQLDPQETDYRHFHEKLLAEQ